MTPDELLHSIPGPHQRVYEAIYRAAYDGDRCPSNIELAHIGGVSTYARWGSDAVSYLARSGLIRVERGRMTRVVVLLSGQATAGAITVGRSVKRCSPSDPQINPAARERFSCSWCGVRSDHGCSHTRRAA